MELLKKRIAKGETEAFVELYDLLGDRLLRYLVSRLNSTDAQDVLQNVFVRLVRYRLRLAKSKNLTAYVFLTARNEANRWTSKSSARAKGRVPEPVCEPVVNDAPIGHHIENQELASQLLGELDDEAQEVIQLKIYSGLTFAEVARIVGMPESTVATKYRRGILKMQSAAIEATDNDRKDTDQSDPLIHQGN